MSTIRGLPIHSISPHFSYNPARRFPLGNCLCVLSVHRICREWSHSVAGGFLFRGRRFPKVALRAHYLCDIPETPASLTAGLRALTVHVANGFPQCGATADGEPSNRRTLIKPGVRPAPQLELLLETLARARSSELGIPVASRGGPGRRSNGL